MRTGSTADQASWANSARHLTQLAGGVGLAIRWCRGGVGSIGGRQSGGVALLNHRLQAGTPAGVRFCWGVVSGGVARAELNHRLRAVIPAG